MAEEMKIGCAKPLSSPKKSEEKQKSADTSESTTKQEEVQAMIQVGQEAPDFSAPAYHKGKFIEIKLSEFRGKWVALCFYPGDFTFV